MVTLKLVAEVLQIIFLVGVAFRWSKLTPASLLKFDPRIFVQGKKALAQFYLILPSFCLPLTRRRKSAG